MKWRLFKRFRYKPVGKGTARFCSCVSRQESSEASGELSEVGAQVGPAAEEEEVFDWPVTPPDDLEIDTQELFSQLESDRSASLARTVDHVVEVFATVGKRHTTGHSPLPDSSNWRTIQKLVIPDHDSSLTRSKDEEEEEEEEEEDLVMHISVDQSRPAFSVISNSTECSVAEEAFSVSADCDNRTDGRLASNHSIPYSTTPGRLVRLKGQRSKSEVVLTTENSSTPSLKTISVVKSLNNLAFREEDYDIAAV